MLLHSLGAMGVDGRLAMALAAHGQHGLPERVRGQCKAARDRGGK
jgi:hypothetical protein